MSEVSPWSVIQSIAERRIEESMARGDFDDLPGRGRPLELEDDSHVPPELRMAYKVLRNAGCVPPELAERKRSAIWPICWNIAGTSRSACARCRNCGS